MLFPGQTRAMTTQGRPATATAPGFTAPPYDPESCEADLRLTAEPTGPRVVPERTTRGATSDRPRAAGPGGRLRGRAHRGPYVQPSAMPSGAMSPLSQGPLTKQFIRDYAAAHATAAASSSIAPVRRASAICA